MGYESLPQNEIQSLVEDQHRGVHLYGNRKKTSTSILTLILLTTATLLCVLALLLLTTLRGSQVCIAGDETWDQSTRYGQNRSRMSLDHQYDFLWDDLLIDGFGVVSTTENLADNKDSFAGISMYVFTLWRLLSHDKPIRRSLLTFP